MSVICVDSAFVEAAVPHNVSPTPDEKGLKVWIVWHLMLYLMNSGKMKIKHVVLQIFYKLHS